MIDWQTLIIASIPGVLATTAAIIAAINSYIDKQITHRVLKETSSTRSEVATLRIEVNHRLEQMIATEHAAGRIAGKAEGVAEEQAKQAIKDQARTEAILAVQASKDISKDPENK